MKNFWIFILFVFFCFNGGIPVYGQSDTMHLYQVYSSFSNAEKAEWTSFENNWNYFEYNHIKTSYRISKLNCKTCENLYADIFIQINNEGRFSVIQFKKGKKCGKECNEPLFIELFENSLKKQQFHSLKNKQFIARFGHILKC
ncbi:MAG: hypothetical protein HY062_15160 [Bacteroidetes bacterium]|nr:hypothetical protein [Bacteroidota bacterium]